MAVPPDGPRYTRNMYRLTNYTKNKLCISLVFLYTIKMDLKEAGCGIWSGLSWLRVGTGNKHL